MSLPPPEAPPGASAKPALRALLLGEAKDSLIFGGSNFLNKFGALLLIPLYMRRLSAEDFGVLGVIAIIGTFQAVISTLGLDLGVTRYYFEWSEEDRKRNVGAISMWSFCSVLVGGSATIGAMWGLSRFLFPQVGFFPWIFLGLLANVCSNLLTLPLALLRIQRRPWLFAVYNLLSFLLQSGLAITYVLILDRGLMGFLLATLWSSSAMALLAWAFMLRMARPRWSSPGLRDMLRVSLPTIPSSLIASFGSMVDRYLLSYFGGLELLGIYAVAMKFVDGMNSVHASLKLSFVPFLMKTVTQDKERGSHTVAVVTPFYVCVYFVAGLGLSIFIPNLITWVGRPEYAPVSIWVGPLVGAAILNCLVAYYGNGIVLGNRTELWSIPHGLSLAVLVVASALLIKEFQMAGLVVTRYLSVGSYFLLSIYLSQRVFPMPQRWGKLVALATLSLLAAAAGLVIADLPILIELFAKALLVAAYCLVCFRFVLGSRAWLLKSAAAG